MYSFLFPISGLSTTHPIPGTPFTYEMFSDLDDRVEWYHMFPLNLFFELPPSTPLHQSALTCYLRTSSRTIRINLYEATLIAGTLMFGSSLSILFQVDQQEILDVELFNLGMQLRRSLLTYSLLTFLLFSSAFPCSLKISNAPLQLSACRAISLKLKLTVRPPASFSRGPWSSTLQPFHLQFF